MDPSRVNRILEDWSAVASEARRPPDPPRKVVRTGLSSGILAGATIVALLLIAVVWLGRQGPNDIIGNVPSPLPSPTATPVVVTPTPTASPVPTASPAPTPTASPVPTASPAPTVGPCDVATLAARISLWEGAAGHQIAHVELTNSGSGPCTVTALARPQLLDGHGSVLIDGSNPSDTAVLTIGPGGIVTTLVQDGDYCGPAPAAPVTVAFVLGDGTKIVASPPTPTDATVPSCLSTPPSAGQIEMQPWSP